MSRTLPAGMATEAEKLKTRPFWVVELMFSTPVRLTSRGAMTIDANSYLAANLKVTVNEKLHTASCQLWNENEQWSDEFLSGASRIVAKLWVGYGANVSAATSLEQVIDGEIGGATVGDKSIRFTLRGQAVQFTPRLIFRKPTFNWLTPKFARFSTPNGVFELRKEI
jgi:hypothetical protein